MTAFYRDESRKDWRNTDHTFPSYGEIATGSLQRIADACELMAKDYRRLSDDCQWYKNRSKELGGELKRQANVIAGLKGYIRRMKRSK